MQYRPLLGLICMLASSLQSLTKLSGSTTTTALLHPRNNYNSLSNIATPTLTKTRMARTSSTRATRSQSSRQNRLTNSSTSASVSSTAIAAAPKSNQNDDTGHADSSSCKEKDRPSLYLLKSEPHEFSIQHLKEKGREEWDGVRNYTARNFMRQMKIGDQCWFYHSSCKTPAIVGLCRIAREAQPDQTALDPQHENYDAKSTTIENCRWDSVLVEFDSIYETPITLKELREQAKQGNQVIAGMMLLRQSRLSVMPVTTQEWNAVQDLIQRKERNEDLTGQSSSSISKGKKPSKKNS